MELLIKNMVCNRCILVVGQELEKLGLAAAHVTLGRVQFAHLPTRQQLEQLNRQLMDVGFEILDDDRKKIIERIKKIIIDHIHHDEGDEQQNYSSILSRQLNKDYSFLSRLFSAVECITIEKFIINQKIEKVKELITYNEFTLSEIAYQLGYSSVAYLSAQFRKVTGLTPTQFKASGSRGRKAIDHI